MTRRLRHRLAALAALAWLCQGERGLAADIPVDLELVLAVDVSLSMDLDELQLQRQGYVAAFRDPAVIAAIRQGTLGRIAVAYVQWAGTGTARLALPWALIDGAVSATAFSDALAALDIVRLHRTSISDALAFSSTLFDGNGFAGARRVIDVSGDGPNNQGPPVTAVREVVTRQGITINGLPILLKASERPTWVDLENLDKYYEDCVIGGLGAFFVRVRARGEFTAAIRRKLILEIAAPRPRLMLAQAERVIPTTDCLIGEKMWREWLGGHEP